MHVSTSCSIQKILVVNTFEVPKTLYLLFPTGILTFYYPTLSLFDSSLKFNKLYECSFLNFVILFEFFSQSQVNFKAYSSYFFLNFKGKILSSFFLIYLRATAEGFSQLLIKVPKYLLKKKSDKSYLFLSVRLTR